MSQMKQPSKIIILILPHSETPEERKRFEKERVAEVLGTMRKSKSIAKKRAEQITKNLEVQ